jgi:hypothetical protein
MGYFVIADDGNKYGPADLATLNAWIAEGRLQPNTILEEAQTMERRPASAVLGLNVLGAPGPQSAQTYANPTQGQPGPTMGQPGAYGGYQQGYGMSGVGSGISAAAKSAINKAWITTVLGLFGVLCSCIFIPIYGIICASKAEKLGHPQGKMVKIVNIVLLVLAFSGIIIRAISRSSIHYWSY